tara:strand:+ start:7052 stop:8383 length:1332 start_codon:yes stop_codon:yes gene_type:complete
MSNQTEVQNASGGVSPSSYTIKKAELFPSNKSKPVDIRQMIMKMDFIESLGQPYIECVAFLQDAGNFLSTLKLNGNEKVSFTIGRKKQDNSETLDEKQKWELELQVMELYGYSRMSPSKQFYTLKMVSPWLMVNNAKKVVNAFEGTIASNIEKLLKNNLGIERIEKINTSSKTPVKGVYPSMKPMQAALWLLNSCYEESMPFFLYETCNKGIYLDSLKSMFEKEVTHTFELKPFFGSTPGTPEYYDEVAKRIVKFSSPLNYSQMSNTQKGVYASKVEMIDIFNKKFIVEEYRYKDNEKLNKFQPFSKNDEFGGIKLNETVDAKHYYISLNDGAFEDANIHTPLNNTIMKGEAQYEALSTNTMNIDIIGDFGLEVGNIIKVDVSKASSADQMDESKMIDKYLSGKYLVKKIESTMYEKFTQRLTLARDSVGIDIDEKESKEGEG